jgi:hypothetical protein
VEYLQELLGLKLHKDIKVDGDFGQTTVNAVLAFQKSAGLEVDGTVGNQTWAALRDGAPEKPSTDQRAPHSFEETGKQARWYMKDLQAMYDPALDELQLMAISTGEQPIDDNKATVRITPPNGKAKVVAVVIGPPDGKPFGDQAEPYTVKLKNFKATFLAATPEVKPEDCTVEAYFDQEIGGESFKGAIISL